jgi:hypothetical protein
MPPPQREWITIANDTIENDQGKKKINDPY